MAFGGRPQGEFRELGTLGEDPRSGAAGLRSLGAGGGNPDPVGIRSLVPARRLCSSRASQRRSVPFCGPDPAEGRPWALGVPSTTERVGSNV